MFGHLLAELNKASYKYIPWLSDLWCVCVCDVGCAATQQQRQQQRST